jgi:hypothetical protein
MPNRSKRSMTPVTTIPQPVESLIHIVRGQKIMLDSDLAALYEVETKMLNRAVARNHERFPEHFMFQLTKKEDESLRCQIGTSNGGRGGRRYAPYAFTEHGVVMLSAVLNSPRAVHVSLMVVNAFIRMRELMASNKDIAARVEKLERSHSRTASVIEVLVEDIDRLGQEVKRMKTQPQATKRRIGFIIDKD